MKIIFKILLLRNCKEDEAENWHTCIGHCPLQKLCFYSSQIRTLVAMATYCFHRLIMGKVEIGNFYCVIVDNRILFLQKSLLNSSLNLNLNSLLVKRQIDNPSPGAVTGGN